MRTLNTVSTVALLSLIAAPTLAQETRELGSHEHGVGILNIAVEGDTILMELEAPGADIVGFEHPAESDADRDAIEEAVATLARPLDLFVLPAAAGCTVMQASAGLEMDGEREDHEGEEHAKMDHDDHDDHGEEHAEMDDHDHEEGATHTEFHGEYAFTCEDPGAVTSIDFAYFETFPNARELEIQLVTDKGAEAFEVEREAPRLDLSGMM